MQGIAQGQNILLKRTNAFGITGRYLELSEENLRYCSHCKFSNKTPTFTPRHCLSGLRRILSVVFWVWMNLLTLENVFRSRLFPCTYAVMHSFPLDGYLEKWVGSAFKFTFLFMTVLLVL